MSDDKLPFERIELYPPAIPGAEPITIADVTVSGPPGFKATIKAYNWPLSEGVEDVEKRLSPSATVSIIDSNKELFRITASGEIRYSDTLTLDEAKYCIEQLLRTMGAIQ